MMIRNSLKALLFIVTTIFLYNCSKNEDIPQDIEINDFVWGGMNAYYKWQGSVPDLSDRKFSSRSELNGYLSSFSDPANLFNSLLSYPNEYPKDPDRVFSWIVDDYVALQNSFQGRRTTSGIKAVVAPYENGSDSVYVYVRDVIIGSDAEAKGVTRGMIFNKINGQHLLQGNYRSLFDNNPYTITLASSFNGGNPIAGTTDIELVKTETPENPVKIAKVITQGSKKIGYLMYNQFASSYDGQLNAAFADFKSQGITDLIVDLRYNGGGSVNSAVYLSSMITGQFNGELFSQQIWNEKVMANVKNQEQFKDYFTDRIYNKNSDGNVVLNEVINSVGMTTVYFIVTDDTASASELVINGLKAYIDVKLVGTETVGKQVGSITLFDGEDYTTKNINPRHRWAMQPITFEITNKDGENNPNGYNPEVQFTEDPANLGVLGDITEPMLARTLQYISTGARGVSTQNRTTSREKLWNSEMDNLDYQNMYLDINR